MAGPVGAAAGLAAVAVMLRQAIGVVPRCRSRLALVVLDILISRLYYNPMRPQPNPSPPLTKKFLGPGKSGQAGRAGVRRVVRAITHCNCR